jgi:hypothetical protein
MEQRRDHIVPVPPFFLVLRCIQMVLALVVLGLSAYGLSGFAVLGGASFSIFVALVTMIIGGWYLLSSRQIPALYHKVAVLVLECFLLIWWLAAWADLAAWAGGYDFYAVTTSSVCAYGYCAPFKKRAVDVNSWENYRNAMAAAAGIGALNFILFIVTLVTFAIYFHRHRIAGSPWGYGGHWANGIPNGNVGGGPANQIVAARVEQVPQYDIKQPTMQTIPVQYTGESIPMQPVQVSPVQSVVQPQPYGGYSELHGQGVAHEKS